MKSERAHAVLGASGAHRWMNCPGSVRLTADLPKITTDYAREGTAAHALAEVWLRLGSIEGITEIEGVPVTDEMREAVRMYVDLVHDTFLPGAPRIEHRIDLYKLALGSVEMFGTADCFGFVGGVVRVFDFKYGQGVPVEVRDNPQLYYYALGAAFALEPGVASWQQAIDLYDGYEVTIVQPRAPHLDGPIRTAVISPHELSLFAGRLLNAARATRQPDAPLVPGSWCRFCPAQAHCPALKKRAQALAQVEFEAMPLDLPPQPEHLPLAVVADILDKVEVLEDWIRALRVRVQRELEAGHEVPGWKLVPRRPTRQWVNTESVLRWARDYGLDTSDLFARTLKSPAQVEKVVGKRALPPDLYVAVSSGHTLAPANDPRPAVSGGAQNDFLALPSGKTEEQE